MGVSAPANRAKCGVEWWKALDKMEYEAVRVEGGKGFEVSVTAMVSALWSMSDMSDE